MVEVSDHPKIDFLSITELAATDSLYRPMTGTIETVPDYPLLEIFSFYVEDARGSVQSDMVEQIDAWHALVHVCQRWRSLVFASSRRLNLIILCTQTRRPRKIPKFWPALPIVIWCEEICYANTDIPEKPMVGAENIVSALRRRDRVSQISLLNIPFTKLCWFIKSMYASYPMLTHVELGPGDNDGPVLDDPVLEDSFLGGSAPCLRSLRLNGIFFPALPKLLLSTTDLVDLHLLDVPPFGSISPGELAYHLSTLIRLEDLRIGFFFPSLDDNQHGLLTRVDLLYLTRLDINSPIEYLEDFVARINTPLLRVFQVMFYGEPVNLNTPQLTDFVDRAERFEVLNQAELHFNSDALHKSDNIAVKLLSQKESANLTILKLQSDFDPSGGRFLAPEQARSSFPSLISPLEYLSFTEDESKPLFCHVPMEDAWWLQLLRPFTAVKHLYLAGQPGLFVARALHELSWEGVVEVLPALQSVFLEGPQPSEDVVEAIGPFIVRRQLSGHPVTVHSWGGKGANDRYVLR
jgi:hypothetical protein